MHLDMTTLNDWYSTPLGKVFQHCVAQHLKQHWPPQKMDNNARILCMGYGAPYLPLWKKGEVIWAQPAGMGGVPWPKNKPTQSVMVWERELPFLDSTFDHIILLHTLEFAEGATPVLEECYRVLRPEGRLLLTVPNRTGSWARRENSPLGRGHPYSRRQVQKMLSKSGFSIENIETAVFMPPVHWVPFHKTAPVWERVGRMCCPAIGGLVVAEGKKNVLGGQVIRAKNTRRFVPLWRPVGAATLSSIRSQKV